MEARPGLVRAGARAGPEAASAFSSTTVWRPAILTSGASDLSRYVVVTFDDAYRDNLTRALPILEELGVPAAVFAATRYADCPAPFPWFPDPVADPDGVPLGWRKSVV